MASLRSLAADKEHSELRLETQMKQQQAAAEQEKAILRSRADRLSRLRADYTPKLRPRHRRIDLLRGHLAAVRAQLCEQRPCVAARHCAELS